MAITNSCVVIKGSVIGTPAYAEGAHYYAFSKTLDFSKYSSIMATVILPIKSNIVWTGDGKARNAYISFGMYSQDNYSCDMGLANIAGKGWHLYYGGSVCPETPHHSTIFPDSTAKVTLTAQWDQANSPSGKSRMVLYAKCLDKDGNPVTLPNGESFVYWEFDVTAHVWNRYFRFVSLLHTGDNSIDDGTKMMGTQFTSLGVYNETKKAYEAWGITASTNLLKDAWIVGYPNGSFTDGSITATSEIFNINNQ